MVRVPEAKSDCSRRGAAEVPIINYKTTWSEFQIPSPSSPAEAKLRYVYSILKPHVRVPSPPQSQSQAVVCVSTPRKYPRSGYFLVIYISECYDRYLIKEQGWKRKKWYQGRICIALGSIWFDLHENEATHWLNFHVNISYRRYFIWYVTKSQGRGCSQIFSQIF